MLAAKELPRRGIEKWLEKVTKTSLESEGAEGKIGDKNGRRQTYSERKN